MIPRTLIYKISITLLLTLTVAILYSTEIQHGGYLDIAFLDVGQGDGAIIDIHKSNQNPVRIMIDTGRGEKTMQSMQNYFHKSISDYLSTVINQSEIDTLILTHNDDDHIGMRCAIINRYNVKRIIISDSMSTSSLLSCDKDKIIENKLNTDNITLNYVHTGDIISIRNINLKILNPDKELNSETLQKSKTKNNSDNQKSIVVLLEAYNNKILFTGDIDKKIERQIINADLNSTPSAYGSSPRGALKNIDILKVAHHGSDGSSDPLFIKYTQPKISVISVGKNSYGHPSPRVISDLLSASSTVMRTDILGNIVFHFE